MKLLSHFVIVFSIFVIGNCSSEILQPRKYWTLISSIYQRYDTSGIVLAVGLNDQSFEMLTFIHEIAHTVSANRIMNVIVDISSLEQKTIFSKRPEYRNSLIIFIIRTIGDISELKNVIKMNIKIRTPVVLTIFVGAKKHDDVCKFCGNPSNISVNLNYATNFIVSCCDYSELKKWLSSGSNTTMIIHYGNLISEKMIWTDQLVSREKYSLPHIKLRVSVLNNSDFVVEQKYVYSGFLGEVVTELIRNLKITFSSFTVETFSGSWDEDEAEWSGLLGSVWTGESDIGLALIAMTTRRREAVDFMVPLITSRANLYIKKPEVSATIQWSSYFKTFNDKVWLSIVGIILITSVLLSVIIYQPWQNTLSSVISHNFLHIWGLFCQQGLSEIPLQLSIRITYLSIFITVFIVFATYSGCLTSFFTTPPIKLPFNNMEEFFEQTEYELITLQESSDYDVFADSDSQLSEKMLNLLRPKRSLPLTLAEGFEIICNEKVAFYTSKSYKMPRFTDSPCEVVPIETGKVFSLGMILHRDSPFLGLLSTRIYRFRDHGILKRLRDKYFRTEQTEEQKHDPVNIWGVVPIIAILGGGIIISLMLLCIEHLTFVRSELKNTKFKKNRQRRKMNPRKKRKQLHRVFEYCP